MAAGAALRRADWRWLLPRRAADRALSLAGGELAAAARAAGDALARRLDDHDAAGARAPDGAYDLVIASRADAGTLRRARVALAEGGTLYAECPGARRVGARRLRRRVAAAGFDAVEVVAPWPSLGAARAWLPLATPAPARYFLLRHPVAARRWLRRLWLALARGGSLLALAAGRPAALVVVARAGAPRAPGGAAGAGRLPPWWVAGAAALAHGGARPEGAEWLLAARARSAESRVLGMLLEPGGRGAEAVVKLARTAAAAARMARGARALELLRAAGVTGRGAAPEPLGTLADGAGRVVAAVERAVPGRWLDAALRRRALPRVTDEVTDWLVALALATRGAPRADTWERALRPTVERFAEHCGPLVDGALLAAATARLAAVGPLPTVFEHHDFRPWNLYRTPSRGLVAFDWDNGRPDGLPAVDLLQCHAFLAFALDGTMRAHRFGDAQRRAEAGPLGAVRAAGVARYAAAVGLDDAAVRALRAFAWMGLAADQAEERARSGRPLARADVPATFLSLWEVEARRALA